MPGFLMQSIANSQENLIKESVRRAILIKDSIHKMKYTSESDLRSKNGFTMSELLASIAIVGIASSVAIPSHMGQIEKARQNEATATIAQIQTTIASYSDEFGVLPTSWKELNSTSAIMTTNGPANQTDFEPIVLDGANYTAAIANKDNQFTIVAIQPGTQGLSEVICDTEFGTRDIEKCGRLFHKKCVDKFSVNSITLINQNECGRRPIAACLNLTNGASDIDKIKKTGSIISPVCGENK
jgi:type IV pilus assembly protein PilA